MVVVYGEEPVDISRVRHVVNEKFHLCEVEIVGQDMPTFSVSARICGFYTSGQYGALR